MSIFFNLRNALVVLALLMGSVSLLQANTYTVTDATCDTTVAGSLGDAVRLANQNVGMDTIQFNLPAGTSLTVFRTLTFTDPVTLDGGVGNVVIGTNQTADLFRFSTNTDQSIVRNIAVVSSRQGIVLDAGRNIRIQGCRIGTDWNNTLLRGNQIGVRVNSLAQALIGGDRTVGEGNVISGNTMLACAGVLLDGSFGNSLCGNIIGLSSDQSIALPNYIGVALADSSGNHLGLPQAGYGNVVAGNTWFQVRSNTVTAQVRWNVVQNNLIGISEGNKTFPSLVDGLRFDNADNNLFGGNRAAGSLERNVASGNNGFGMVVIGNGNTLAGNLAGTDVSGMIGIGNGSSAAGIAVAGNGNVVGGSSQNPGVNYGNLCSGNNTGILVDGSEATYGKMWVAGNVVGLNAAGNAAIPNDTGIIDTGIDTFFGDADPQYRNVISGNTQTALGTVLGKVVGNYFGLNLTGTSVLPNQEYNILVWNGNRSLIGGTQPGEGNIICGGKYGVVLKGDDDGVMTYATGNTVVGNWLGVMPDGSTAPQAFVDAILVSTNAYGNSIGLRTTGQGNLIVGAINGITVDGAGQIQNGLFGNTICAFSGLGIKLHAGGNQNKSAPVITQADTSQIAGTSQANDYIEIFLAEPRPGQQGGSLTRVGSATANGAGAWVLNSPGVAAGYYMCALATNSTNNTSGFSNNALVSSAGPVATPTPTPTASPTPTLTPLEATPTVTVTPTRAVDFHGLKALAFPQPGRNQITFMFDLKERTQVKIEIYNLAGERVARLEGDLTETTPVLIWNSRPVASGIYLSRIFWDGHEVVRMKIAVIH